MTKTQVLFLVSSPIDIDALNDNPNYRDYHINMIAMLDYLRNSNSRGLKNILSVLYEGIDTIKPRIILFHIGLAFERYPFMFVKVLIALHNRFPLIKIGMDKSREYILATIFAISGSLPYPSWLLTEFNKFVIENNDPEILLLSQALV